MATGAAAGPAVNGLSAGDRPLSAAELMKKHEADAAHRATVEEVKDEEDIIHPPPTAAAGAHAAAAPVVEATTGPISAKAAGKQRAADEPRGDRAPTAAAKKDLNTQSHELFPQLGAGLPSRAPPTVAPAWAVKKSSPATPTANGHPPNGSSAASSRASTPASGLATPASSTTSPALPRHAQSQRGPVPQPMSIPGKHSVRITLNPQEMKTRNLLRKPRPELVKEIDRKSKANIKMTAGPGGAIHFDAEGPVEAVRQALTEVARELGSKVNDECARTTARWLTCRKQSIKVAVPASVRPHIIGRQGAIIQGILQRTGARIHVSRPEESGPAVEDDDDDEKAIEVLIEGDSVAAEMARREIEGIVNERTSNVNVRLKGIPAEFYPFIAGPHNSRVASLEDNRDLRVQVPHYQTWTVQPPPAPSSNERPAFSPAMNNPIRLSGDRLAVQQARAEIERQVQQLRQLLTLSQLDINRGQHQFVIGDKGSSAHDFLAETGCVVLMPPDGDDTETLTILGPADMIENGVNKVMDLATSMEMTNVDISRQHPNAPHGPSRHARSLTRYLQQRREIERLERLYDAHIAIPSSGDGPSAWEIYSRDGKNNIRARTEIINIVKGHPPARVAHLDVDPFYHAFVREQSAQKLREEHGVHAVFPDERDESPQVILVFEGAAGCSPSYEVPKKQPSPAEVKEFERGLAEASELLLDLVGRQKEIVSRSVEVPSKFQDKLRRFVSRKQQSLPAGELPVRVEIENGRQSKDATATTRVALRGPVDGVDDLESALQRFVEEETQYERERDYTTTFDYPQKFANFLIGKRGENIRKYRDEFDVEIEVKDGKVEIKGPKTKAEAAKARISALGKRLEDEATHVLKIKPQYHRDLIGPRGNQVNRLQERYNVRINFPRSATAASANDDRSVGDNASEAGAGHKYNRAPQAVDEVIVKGPRKGADEAKDELLTLLQWTIDNSHSAYVSVARNQIPQLIGQGGREMENMRLMTGAQIDVPDNKRDGQDGPSRAEIRVKGTKEQVEAAKKLLEQRAKTFDETVVRTLEVDKKYHKALIGGGGANIRDIVIRAGGPDDRRELAKMVKFPRQGSDESLIKVEGSKATVDKIVADIEKIIAQREKQVEETVEVPTEKHGLLIGRGGETRRSLETRFNVGIEISRLPAAEQTSPDVKVSGLPADVAKAKEHILGMVKGNEGETIQVPRQLHHVVSDNGNIFRRLRQDHKVTVDHAGHQVPEDSRSSAPRSRTNGESMPLITDKPDAEALSWEIVHHDEGSSSESGDIPWMLRGPADRVGKARALVEEAVRQAQQQTSTGYLILQDPQMYRHVVGLGGAQVKAIRKQTGCKITVPRDQAQGEAIVITGERDRVSEAKEMVVEAVRSGRQGGARE
ncbi:MAG: hypothetical protein M1832_006146 [Thelocarpon impressellum]|nr:MAG: hypothetical protein M1832_006146 [Thelocarpon impressellum]